MKLLFIGDVVGAPGRAMLQEYLPLVKRRFAPDIVVVNGENAAGGRGITAEIARQFFEWGVHCITMGNHTWDNKAIFDFIDDEPRIVRPANYPPGTPGRGFAIVAAGGYELAVVNLMGRTFLPPLDCPFRTAEALIDELRRRTPFILVDFHAEATSEKQAMAWFLDGKVSAVVGTHTHVQTADERILPGGTAYISDVGMTGPYDAILGMEREMVIKKFLTGLPVRFSVDEKGRKQLNAVFLELDDQTGKARTIRRLRVDDDHLWSG